MMKVKAYPTLLLVLMGSMDCLTTVIGVLYFGAVELNPFLSGLVSANLPVFVVLKLTTTIFVCLILLRAEKILMRTPNKTTKAFSRTQKLLKIAYAGVIVFLMIVVANNTIVLLQAF